MIVCICHAVSDAHLRELAHGGASEDDVVRLTRAGDACGRCVEAVRECVTTARPACGKAVPCLGCECIADQDKTQEAA
jgi:bacterioferritin-associated ferredoxin